MLTSLGGGLLGLLDRRLVLSAWLPAMLFWGGLGALVVTGLGWPTATRWWLGRPGQFQVTLLVLALAWITFCAYLIAALVPAFIRSGEGYWPRLLSWLVRWRRGRHLARQAQLSKDAAAFGHRHSDYPLRAASVMPTRLGNILRAAEDHALDRYGINAIVVWPRLYVLLPDQFTAAIAAAKLPLDLMAVIGALAAAFAVAGTVVAAILLPWYAALACAGGALLASWLAYAGAVQAARPYAQLIRAGFDVHRGLLLDAAGLRRPRTYGEERRQWEQLSHLWLQGAPEGPAGAALLGYPGLPPAEAAFPAAPAKTSRTRRFLRWLGRVAHVRRPRLTASRTPPPWTATSSARSWSPPGSDRPPDTPSSACLHSTARAIDLAIVTGTRPTSSHLNRRGSEVTKLPRSRRQPSRHRRSGWSHLERGGSDHQRLPLAAIGNRLIGRGIRLAGALRWAGRAG